MAARVFDTGISVVHEPEHCEPVVESWTSNDSHGVPLQDATEEMDLDEHEHEHDHDRRAKSVFRRMATRISLSSSQEPSLNTENSINDGGQSLPKLFWPADLLPSDCPNSRILMFGYDSKITKYGTGAINKNSLLAHGKDLLFSLCRERRLERPVIFVAHSLGGIIVKEALMRSSIEEDADLHDLIESTAAVIFLGTPHRGSQELAAMGEFVRHIASTFRMETASAILDALGLKSTDLERVQEFFSALWQKYDFRVKTFQEGLGLTGINLGVLGNKVVPDYSSTIGNHRERAESLQASHKDMCRFTGFNDPNYRKFVGELRFIYHSIDELGARQIRKVMSKKYPGSAASMISSTKESIGPLLNASVSIDKACLQSLWFPSIFNRHRNLETPAERTCTWLFEHPLYQDWQLGRKREAHQGLLWLKGNPGTGKSVLMKEAFRRAIESQAAQDQLTAAFFFNAKGTVMEACELGMLRSLLFQLLAKDRTSLRLLRELYEQRTMYAMQNSQVEWDEQELQKIFRSAFVSPAEVSVKRTVIFIDALDECDANELRQIVYFWREMTRIAHSNGLMLDICMSSRHFPSIGISGCPEIVMEHHNCPDIATYVAQRFGLGDLQQDPQWQLLRNKILEKASGVFLWTVLVVDDVLSEWDDGKKISFLLKKVDSIPSVLKELFLQMFAKVTSTDQQLTVRLFEWALFAVRPLRLHEWHHILAFIRYPAPNSLAEWRNSDYHTETDEQLEKQIRRISRGLLEVSRACTDDIMNANLDTESICAGAGSLTVDHGETRIVQVIHESVHDLFSSGDGFRALGGLHSPDGGSHLSIMSMCLDYLKIKELDALVEARTQARRRAQVKVAPDKMSGNDNVPRDNSGLSLVASTGADRRPQKFEKQQGLGIILPGENGGFDRSAVFEVLKMSHQEAAGVDIHDWMEINDNILDGMLPKPSSHTTSPPSASAISQILEDYPALLSYATSELFTHAQNAHNNGRLLDNVLHRLYDLGTWERWKTLKEDVPQHLTLEQYVWNIGLGALPLMRPWAESTMFSQQQVIDRCESRSAWHTTSPKLLPSTPKQVGKGSSSVASFSSAGSHIGPVFEESTYSHFSGAIAASPQAPWLSGSHGSEDDEARMCPVPGCGQLYRDLNAHMLSHASERAFKCPISTCEYHKRGFGRKFDRNRHILSYHFRAEIFCGFCPVFQGKNKSFSRADIFKRHLISIHGVERTYWGQFHASALAMREQNVCKPEQGINGKCNLCEVHFKNPQLLYEHFDDCVIRTIRNQHPNYLQSQESENEEKNSCFRCKVLQIKCHDSRPCGPCIENNFRCHPFLSSSGLHHDQSVHSASSMYGRHKRVWKACERCRMKKTKCDGEFPCKRCKDDGLVCTAGVRKNNVHKQLPRRHAKRKLSISSFPEATPMLMSLGIHDNSDDNEGKDKKRRNGKHHQAQDASFSTPWLHDTRANDNQDELSLTGFSKDTPFSYSKSIGSLKRFDSPPTESTQMSRNAVTSGYNSTLHQYHDSPQQDYWHTTAECAAEMSGILPYREKLTESASTVEDEFDLRAHDEMQTGGDCRDGSPE